MQRVLETSLVIEALRVADTAVHADELKSNYQGVVVEVTNGIEFEGTLIYFPGVQLKQIKEHTNVDLIPHLVDPNGGG